MANVNVFVLGGVVNDVTDEFAKDIVHEVFDFDCLEGGQCPICYGDIITVDEEIVSKTVEVPDRVSYYNSAGEYVTEVRRDESGNLQTVEIEVTRREGGREVCEDCDFDWSSGDAGYKELIDWSAKLREERERDNDNS